MEKEKINKLYETYGKDGCAYIHFTMTKDDKNSYMQLVGDYNTTTYGLYKIITELAQNYNITFEEIISDLLYGKEELEKVMGLSKEELEEKIKDIEREEEDKIYN